MPTCGPLYWAGWSGASRQAPLHARLHIDARSLYHGRRRPPYLDPVQRRRRRNPPPTRSSARTRGQDNPACRAGFLRQCAFPSRDPGLHGAGRRSDRHRHRRFPASRPQGRVQCRAARSRHLLDGAHAQSGQRQQPVLHLLRRRDLPRSAIYRLGQCRERHGACRRASEGRAAGEPGQDRQGDGEPGILKRSRFDRLSVSASQRRPVHCAHPEPVEGCLP